MARGGFAGGLASGLQSSMKLNEQRKERKQRNALQERQMATERAQQVQERLDATLENIDAILDEADTKGISRDDRSIRQAIMEFAKSGARLAQDAKTTPAGQLVMGPREFLQRVQNRINLNPTADEEIAVEAQREGEITAAREEAKQTPSATQNDVFIEFADGTSGNFDAVQIEFPDGSSQTLITDPEDGQRKPVDQVFDANKIEAIRPSKQVTRDDTALSQPVTLDDFFTEPEDVEGVDFKAGVGPLDAASALISRTPVFSQLQSAVAGEEAGQEQVTAQKLFSRLDVSIREGLRPGEGRPSNFQLELVEPQIPDFGAFATERATRTQLERLLSVTESEAANQLRAVNNPNLPDKTQEEALAKVRSLAEARNIIVQLLQVERQAGFRAQRELGAPLDELSDAEIAERLRLMDTETADVVIDQLSEERAERVLQALGSEE